MALKLVNRYKELAKLKAPKLSLMRKVQQYVEPPDSSMAERTFRSSSGQAESDQPSSQTIFDVTARNILEDYTLQSLTDIVNPFESWFTLNVKSKTEDDAQAIQEWANTATEEFFTFINKSDYYKKLITDKHYYDLYGFSALSFFEDEQDKVMKIRQENPFSVVVSPDKNEIFWLITLSPFGMEKEFGYKTLEDDKDVIEYKILCAFVPNREVYLDDEFVPDESGKKNFVQLYFIYGKTTSGEKSLETASNKKGQVLEGIGNSDIQEVGDRKFYKEPFVVFVRDWERMGQDYGEGWGKKILIQTQNVNQLRRDLLSVSAYYGNPAIQGPVDTFGQFSSLYPGIYLPHSYTGEKIELLVPKGDFGAQAALLQSEHSQLIESFPSNTSPIKKARQSQFEVDKSFTDSSKKNLIYKITYLNDGVAQHLKLMFRLALKTGAITKPPKEINTEDIEPSLASILVKDYKKQKTSSYTQAISISQGYITFNPEVLDNLNIDEIFRNIYNFLGVSDVLVSVEERDEIRQEREKQREQQEQQAVQGQQAETALIAAKAGNESSKGTKNLADAQATQLGL